MQRLAKPSDYIRQELFGQISYVIPWETRLCPGNPADSPEAGAQLYNEFVQEEAKGVQRLSAQEQVDEIIEWVLQTPGEEARSLAADLAAVYQGKHRFVLDDLARWDAETKAHRAHLVFHNKDIAQLPARTVMALRVRASS